MANSRSLPAVRERLVKSAFRLLGRLPGEHQLRCVPVHRRSRATDETDVAEWRAVFQAEAREWSATGPDREAAIRALEELVTKEAAAAA